MTLNLLQGIKDQAYQLGFSLVGVTTAEPLPHADVFNSWLDEGRHGEMSYLNTPRSRLCRGRPDLILPACRSILVLGMRYPAPTPIIAAINSNQHPHGRIASYAWGADYHDILPVRLRSLVTFIELQVGHSFPSRWYTDTGPLLERELAQRAGLGWIGKNTCLISPEQGSYFLLAEILLGIELEPDQPFNPDRCGTCRRCIQSCPTGCILPDRTLDARRCISYLTIELKGSIPAELRPLMDGWVFGCDVCQSVCPWNHFAAVEGDPAFNHSLTRPTPDLQEEMTLSANDFNLKYRRSPLRRPKRTGYLRNIAIALGNLHADINLLALNEVLMHEHEPLVRAHAAWSLGQLHLESARHALEAAAKVENDPLVKSEILAALAVRRYVI
jgi:epoxyqueuosine reductase